MSMCEGSHFGYIVSHVHIYIYIKSKKTLYFMSFLMYVRFMGGKNYSPPRLKFESKVLVA